VGITDTRSWNPLTWVLFIAGCALFLLAFSAATLFLIEGDEWLLGKAVVCLVYSAVGFIAWGVSLMAED